jgi:hypothetical protein
VKYLSKTDARSPEKEHDLDSSSENQVKTGKEEHKPCGSEKERSQREAWGFPFERPGIKALWYKL